MGLTIVHKSDLTARKRNPRVALVLAGGAVTGGAYKLGGLKALDDFMVNRKTTDFDIYVGPLRRLVPRGAARGRRHAGRDAQVARRLVRRLHATPPSDFYNLNLEEFFWKPIELMVDLVSYAPGVVYDFLVETPGLIRHLEDAIGRARREPSLDALVECVTPVLDAIGSAASSPSRSAYLPSGIFDNSSLERYLRSNIDRAA
jgi:hypothetical protein